LRCQQPHEDRPPKKKTHTPKGKDNCHH
jgi:hypothetical protein